MEIASVGASGAYSSTSVQSARPQPAQEQQQVERREQQLRPEQQVQQTEEAARPVINAQGQETGRLVNTTA
ncbi:hypothetical protein DFR40_2204 [Azonexus fungiphilus]|jgi:hypothetical protein|uniref:Uncharacterized protein n=1 Tax=Azonexus fungiphilus TaxID=146940 RepID=A0A495WAT6_9RHOO|nr:hypothetical protein [Azonexus fungiphilus]NHC05363.1 hypothetical protein [Azonexus fungiphilus]RKT58260.1 hypothetical protein DFR40_2204 [Azonexus fungiphilus]